MSRRERTVAPTTTLIPFDQLKNHLNIVHDADDLLISLKFDQAVDIVERYIDRAFLTQTWVCYLDSFPAKGYPIWDLRPCPIQSITSIEYYSGGEWVTLSSDEYTAKIQGDQPGEIAMVNYDSWPTTDSTPQAVKITYVCGYASAAAVPAVYKAAALSVLGELYENRELDVVGASITPNKVLERLLFVNRCIGL